MKSGRRLLGSALRKAAADTGKSVLIQGPGPKFHLGFTDRAEVRDLRDTFAYDRARYAAFAAAMQDRGLRLIGRGLWYLSAAHSTDEVDHAIATAREVLTSLN